ncbi:Cna protein B-type domain protein [Crateriforma conspicua]|uniref:Cna protein B-type domain protein n=1 Tax=Crateriforma conspicua TaxID=2527996 RepID=A0A5C6FWI9_9PLAN|nr:SdrD B-like domain-containing protein [Crateriforma conspicua]TWU67357.1 Cna protein B-type domain protein [Crateriforma conspicua]
MVLHRLFHRLTASDRRDRSTGRRRIARRRMLLERLDRREVLAANIGQIVGVAFTDQTGDGLTGDDPRLENVQVQLYLDNGNGVFDSGVDTLQGTVFTDAAADPNPGQYEFNDLPAGDYFVVQATSGTLTAPDPTLVTVTADNADGETIVTIDEFTTGDQLVTATGGATQTGSVAAGSALGGQRDMQLIHTNGAGNTNLQVDTGTELLSLSTGGGATAIGTVEYDGADGAFGLNLPPGFATQSLAGATAGEAAPTNTGLEVLARAENQDETLRLIVYSSATEASEATITIPVNATLQSVFVDFASFAQSGDAGISGPADFNSIVAVRAQAEVTLADNDIFFSVVESRGPDPVTANLSNTQLVQLGGTVFIDNGPNAGEQNDGIQQGTEAGVENVVVDLYEVATAGGTINTATDTPIDSVQTGPGGDYLFTDLDPGHYVVVIPNAEFGATEPLFGHQTSTGNDPAPDPDDNTDDDDNGSLVAGFGIVSGTITLESNSEPTTEADDSDADGLNSNRNLTLDFGVIPVVDLTISKTVNAALSGDDEDDQAVFDIAVTNNGPLTATNVEVEDIIPAGLTFNSLANEGSATATVNGSTITIDLGDITSGGSFTFQIVADIDANQTDDVTNTATVDTADQVDIDPNNNSSTATLDLRSTPLTITKVDLTDPVVAGGQFSYEITVTNTSTTDTANGVQVEDVLPTGLTFSSGLVTLPDGSTNANLVQSNPDGNNAALVRGTIGNLAPGESATVTITVDVAIDASTTINNTATVTATPNTIPAGNDNDDDEQTTVTREVDVQIDKQISTQTPVAGGSAFTYTITVQNNGPSIAENVEVDDDLDDLLSYVAASFNDNGSGITFTQDGTDPTLLNFDIGSLSPGAANAVTFSFDVTLDAAATGTLDNTAVVSTTSTDTVAANNTDTESVTISRDVDLAITKAVNETTLVPGEITAGNPALVWTIEVTNNGTSDAFNVVVSDDINDELNVNGQITTVTVDAGAFTVTNPDSTPTVSFGTIPAGETRSFTISAEIPAAATGDIVNNAVVDADDINPVTSNTVTTTLTPDFDLTVDKTVSGTASLNPGNQVTFQIDVFHDTAGAETSPSRATGVVLTDLLPDGLTFVSATAAGSSVTPTTTVNGDGTTSVVFSSFDLDPGQTRTFTVTASVDNDADGTLTNNASFVTDAGESDTNNNDDDANVTVTPIVDVSVTKTVNLADAQVGSELVWTVTVTNGGPSIAEAVTAVDTLPAGVTFVSGSGPNGESLTPSGNQITVNGGDLASGSSYSFTIRATIDSGASGDLQNQVAVSTTTNETVTNNNSALAVTSVDPVTSELSGRVYVDANENGQFDTGEAGIEGVTIALTGTDSLGNSVSRTATTDANGEYVFASLAQGTYRLEETEQPADFLDGDEDADNNLNPTITDEVFADIALDPDTIVPGFNFGELERPPEGLSKRRFLASST